MEASAHFNMMTTIEPNGILTSVITTSSGSREERMTSVVGRFAGGTGFSFSGVSSGKGICSPQAEQVWVFSRE
jgi:hypothetical protein